jgi:hypothetical protein
VKTIEGIGKMLGDISGKYESGNRADTVSSDAGDLGGISCGAHQFIASVTNAFVLWLKEQNYEYAERLSQNRAGTASFSEVWEEVRKRITVIF